MIESGSKLRHLVIFENGEPTSPFVYTLYNQAGDVVTTNTVVIPSGSLSYTIEITGPQNVTNNPFFEQMKLEWSYTAGSILIDESFRYTISAPIPFPVSENGVREQLGVSKDEVSDEEINLLAGYASFRGLIGDDLDISAFETAGDLNSYRIARAIEASAALLIFPQLQIKLPKKYDSGTSSYERWNSVDWDSMRTDLEETLYTAVTLINPLFERFTFIDAFRLSNRPSDPITGA